MKKRIGIGLIVLCMLLLFVPAASANAPVPDPYSCWLDYQNVPEGATLTVLTADGEELNTITPQSEQGRITIHNPTEADFVVRLKLSDGTTVQSAPVRFEGRAYFRFDGATGVLEAGRYLKSEDTTTPILLILAGVGLFLALQITILVEMLVGLCFRLRRIYRVILINLITNPVMNVLLLLLTFSISGEKTYWIALLVLEALVCGFEFWFYARKYRDRKKWVLLIFTLTANAASAAAGLLPVWLLLR